MTLYNCKREIDRDGVETYRITKFTTDLDVEASYLTTREACDCPAGQRKSCRHRQMLPMFLARDGGINGQTMLDFEAKRFIIHFPPDGTFINLDDPAVLHNTIARALGEPEIGNSEKLPDEPDPQAYSGDSNQPLPTFTRRV